MFREDFEDLRKTKRHINRCWGFAQVWRRFLSVFFSGFHLPERRNLHTGFDTIFVLIAVRRFMRRFLRRFIAQISVRRFLRGFWVLN